MIVISKKNAHQLSTIFDAHQKIHGFVSLDGTMSALDLLDLVKFGKKMPYFHELSELVAQHHNANDKIFRKIYLYSKNNLFILNGLATSKTCPKDILMKLIKSSWRSVSEHAKINLLSKSIDAMTESEIENLIFNHHGDGALDVGMRTVIANSFSTPNNILKNLINDDVDFVASAAKENFHSKFK